MWKLAISVGAKSVETRNWRRGPRVWKLAIGVGPRVWKLAIAVGPRVWKLAIGALISRVEAR